MVKLIKGKTKVKKIYKVEIIKSCFIKHEYFETYEIAKKFANNVLDNCSRKDDKPSIKFAEIYMITEDDIDNKNFLLNYYYN